MTVITVSACRDIVVSTVKSKRMSVHQALVCMARVRYLPHYCAHTSSLPEQALGWHPLEFSCWHGILTT